MTKDNLITVPVGTTLNEAKAILQRYRVEKLLVVDDNYRLKGLITVKDIQKAIGIRSRPRTTWAGCGLPQRSVRQGISWSARKNWFERASTRW